MASKKNGTNGHRKPDDAIDQLAGTIKAGFQHVDEQFKQVRQQLNDTETRLHMRLDNILLTVGGEIRGIKDRVEKLESK